MNVWYHLPTIFNRRVVLQIAVILAMCVALITTLLFGMRADAAPGVNQTIGFQGRLLDSGANVVPDGHYNIQFKIYQDGSGSTAGNPDGTLKWTETYINNGGNNGIEVKNGYFSVNLGSLTSFGSSIDWNQDTIWLSMNVAGSSTSCTTFGSSPCVADGEMLPMKRLTASPYAINSGMVGGKSVGELAQLGQGVQTDSSNNSSLFINKTGSGQLMQLQNMAADVFSIASTGDVLFGNNVDHSVSVAASATNTAGNDLLFAAGAGGTGTGSAGGDLILNGGDAGGTNGDGGDITLAAGTKTGSGISGQVSIKTNDTTRFTISGDENTAYFGNGASSAAPNSFKIQGTDSSTTAVTGGALTIQGGNATVGNANGGNVTIAGGAGVGTGTTGLIIMGTPTFSTVADDANCYTSGTPVETSCTIAASSVNSSAAIIVGFSETGQTATLPDPTITTAGRLMYIMAADTSESFTLAMNGGGAGNELTLTQNTATTLIWNGSDWLVAGTSSSATLLGSKGIDGPTVQIGSGTDDGEITLLTVDKSDDAPVVTDTEAMLGSIYYDTTVGKLQCYEATGWGDCSSSPDSFVTLSPEYSNAVTNGAGTGTMTSDLCSDSLDINDDTTAKTVCDENETYNFYNWTSAEVSSQTKSIYVTYQLPTNFKQFVSGSTSLMGRTDSSDAIATYQVYKNHSGSGLTACGSLISVATGDTGWQQAVATSTADPSTCGFAAGDSIVLKISLSASNDANAYVSNLGFAYSTQ